MISNISNIWNWFIDFFGELLNFFYHIFVPTEEQWEAIKEDYNDVSNTFKNPR